MSNYIDTAKHLLSVAQALLEFPVSADSDDSLMEHGHPVDTDFVNAISWQTVGEVNDVEDPRFKLDHTSQITPHMAPKRAAPAPSKPRGRPRNNPV